MTILKRVTDMITTTKWAYSASHHLMLGYFVSSLSDNRSFRRTILHGMMGDQGISSGVIPHGLGESICDMSLVGAGSSEMICACPNRFRADLMQARKSSLLPPCPPLSF